MIRKIKSILNSKDHSQTTGVYDFHLNHAISNKQNLNNQNHQTKSNSGSPVSYIKKKIRSTKSWVKLPKSAKLVQHEDESAYEPVNNEFESYTRINRTQNQNEQVQIDYHNSPNSVKTTNILKHSTLNNAKNNNNNSQKHQETDIRLHSKIFDKLGRASIDKPANIPILCITTFSLNSPKWTQLSNKFNSCGLNVRLIELQKGVPINALFYLSNLDLIYVKTADDLEGYVPRDCCKPISCNESNFCSNYIGCASKQLFSENSTDNYNYKQTNDTDTLNTNSNNYSDDKSNINESIKYHSLSIESEYDDLIETEEMNLKADKMLNDNKSINKNQRNQECFGYDTSQHSLMDQNGHQISSSNTDYSLYKYRDSGYRSEIENTMNNFSVNNYKTVDDYDESVQASPEKSTRNFNKDLLNMQSRSRLPISIRSNLNLTLMDDQSNPNYVNKELHQRDQNVYCNITYKSPFVNNSNFRMSARNMSPKYSHKNEFKRNNIRRSLDSYLSNGNDSNSRLQSFYAVSIELDENKVNKNNYYNKASSAGPEPEISTNSFYPDLDLNRIELDSLNELDPSLNKKSVFTKEPLYVNKIWTIILKHEARNFQEISVTPGMLVLVIKEFNELLYVKLIGFENSNLNLSQQYGIIPRSCAVDLQEIIYNSNKSLNNLGHNNIINRKSQITAL